MRIWKGWSDMEKRYAERLLDVGRRGGTREQFKKRMRAVNWFFRSSLSGNENYYVNVMGFRSELIKAYEFLSGNFADEVNISGQHVSPDDKKWLLEKLAECVRRNNHDWEFLDIASRHGIYP